MSTITFEGNLAQDPELRFTQGGTAVANLVVLENRRQKNQAGEWEDATPTRHQVVVWAALAENVAESLTKGATVLIAGELFTEQWADRETGEARYSTKVKAHAVGASLRYATATLTKSSRKTEPEADQG